jgi:uncharacterized surface protein with fasciclin (FAS1) repeats
VGGTIQAQEKMMNRKMLAALAVSTLVLAACSTDSSETTAARTTQTPATTEAPATTVAPATTEAQMTIVDVASAAGGFTTLLAAAEAAGLVETLMGDGPFTVFAPTDEAFAALPEGSLESLLADPEALKQILLYHVVSGSVLAADVVGLDTAPSVEGSEIDITVDGDMVMVNEANVVATDIMASNGVIHVIDAVILPPAS